MICIGTPIALSSLPDGFKVYNYLTTMEGLQKLNLLPPPIDQDTSGFDFDMYYANWLMNDPSAFRDLMLVMYDFYSGYDVYLAANLQLVGNIAESFVKFIQQRYGVNCYMINAPEDLLYAIDTGAGFSMEGIGNFDLDKERLSTIAMASTQTDPRMANSYYGFILASNENGTENININPVQRNGYAL